MNTTILLLTFNGADELDASLTHLLPLPDGFDLLIIDNGSQDTSVAIAHRYAASHARVNVVELGANYGFSGGMNTGIRLATSEEQHVGVSVPRADVVVLLNQDACVLDGWHTAIVAPFADDPTIGAVGCLIYQNDRRTIEHLGARVEYPRAMTTHIQPASTEIPTGLLDVEYATGAALALRTSVLEEVGSFDERYNPAYCEEIDLCNRIRRAGYRVVVNPAARVVHETGAGSDMLARLRMFHRGRLLYLYKTAAVADLINAFAPAEHAYIANHAGQTTFVASREAYTDALFRFDDWMQARSEYQASPPTSAERDQLRALLRNLRMDSIRQDRQAIAQHMGQD